MLRICSPEADHIGEPVKSGQYPIPVTSQYNKARETLACCVLDPRNQGICCCILKKVPTLSLSLTQHSCFGFFATGCGGDVKVNVNGRLQQEQKPAQVASKKRTCKSNRMMSTLSTLSKVLKTT